MFASRKNAKLLRTELKQGLFSLRFTKKLYFNSYKHDSGIPFQHLHKPNRTLLRINVLILPTQEITEKR